MVKWQEFIALNGGVEFVVDLFHDEDLMEQCWYLLMAMLDEGNSKVQTELQRVLYTSSNARSFALALREQIQRAVFDLSTSTRETIYQREAELATAEAIGEDAENIEDLPLLSPSDESTFAWLWSLLRGIQLFVEGSDKHLLQDALRGVRPNGANSVNFIAELTKQLQEIYTLIETGNEWLEVVSQYLETLTEMCQGNLSNQQETIDNQIFKPLNYLISYHTSDINELVNMSEVKLMALELIEV